jgi:hypothetical protein
MGTLRLAGVMLPFRLIGENPLDSIELDLARDLLTIGDVKGQDRNENVTSVSYTVPPNWTAGSDKTGAGKNKNPNDPNMLTTGAYGNAFELMLDTKTNSDGTTTDTLTYKSYSGQTNGTFSAVSDSGQGTDLASAYQSLLSTMQANGEMNDATASQLKDAFNQLESKSGNGSADATVSGGEMLVQAGGPVYFNGISSYQNNAVDSIINDLTSELRHNSIA